MTTNNTARGPEDGNRDAARLKTEWTAAALSAEKALEVPRGLMSFASDGRGRPTNEQKYLYLSAVTFTYAVWESYAEDVAIELVEVLASSLPTDSIPTHVADVLSGKDAWQLAVHPGWRGLWTKEVNTAAKGGEGAGYGINTASYKNVRALFELAGIGDALPSHLSVAPETELGKLKGLPASVGVTKNATVNVDRCLSLLINLRGEAVHTARTEGKLLKNEVLWWTAFIRELHEEVDRRSRGTIIDLLKL
ncbi:MULTISPECIES: hypothetical protein [Micrococcales]|uniref:RiboL-PSP-HEPN domain-containing protein n=1 Tax=Brachybacterium fresconis TaxID=173363 RepID=A0ABS4YEW6_9MICO|nr:MULTISPECIES: hypothetical protein [Micrococcales]MBP2407328.1 hypothetical protein [Brachybacterium fresconis]MDN5605608.1 hypothetical protein [Kocuria sp.]MDN5659000.1 hypothetical protein [Brevibacterium sandarakinum]